MAEDDRGSSVPSDAELFPLQEATLRYLALLEETFHKQRALLETAVRANILLHIKPGGHVRHIVCPGRNKGFYSEPTDDPVHFILSIEEWLILAMLSSEWKEEMLDFDRYRREGAFQTE